MENIHQLFFSRDYKNFKLALSLAQNEPERRALLGILKPLKEAWKEGLIAFYGGSVWQNDLPETEKELKDLFEFLGLTRLDLSDKGLKVFPEWIFSLKALEFLDLAENQLKEVPKAIGMLPQLSFLKLNDNQLTYLPQEICDLKELEVLMLFKNQLKELPEGFGDYPKLKTLSLIVNQLKELPENLGKATNLEYLHLFANELEYLPASFIDLRKLKELTIDNLTYDVGHPKELDWTQFEKDNPNCVIDYY